MATTLAQAVSPHTGLYLNDTTSSPVINLGMRIFDVEGRVLQYVVAGGTITADAPITISAAYSATVSGNAGRVDGVAPLAVASGYYFWAVIGGQVTADVETGLAIGESFLWTTNASGQLDEVALATDKARGFLVGAAASNKAVVRLHG